MVQRSSRVAASRGRVRVSSRRAVPIAQVAGPGGEDVDDCFSSLESSGGVKQGFHQADLPQHSAERAEFRQHTFSRHKDGFQGEVEEGEEVAAVSPAPSGADLPRIVGESDLASGSTGVLLEALLRQQREDRAVILQLQRRLLQPQVPTLPSPVAPMGVQKRSVGVARSPLSFASSGFSRPKSATEDLKTAPSKRVELKGEANVVNHGVCAKAVAALREAGELLTEPVDVQEASEILLQGDCFLL